MKASDPVLDTAGTEIIETFCKDDERNHLASLELKHFEKHGEFLYLHPILQEQAQEHELEILRKSNPAEFTKQMVNARKSIDRYVSRINNKKYKNTDELDEWNRLIDHYTGKIEMMQVLISK